MCSLYSSIFYIYDAVWCQHCGNLHILHACIGCTSRFKVADGSTSTCNTCSLFWSESSSPSWPGLPASGKLTRKQLSLPTTKIDGFEVFQVSEITRTCWEVQRIPCFLRECVQVLREFMKILCDFWRHAASLLLEVLLSRTQQPFECTMLLKII